MKSIIIIYYFCLLLSTINSNGDGNHPLTKKLNQMAETKTEKINGVFKPSKDGYLGEDVYNRMYKGTFIPKNKEVAMKFMRDQVESEHEYKMYSYLDAINKQDVEARGIPSIYYYGTWESYYIMAVTLLDPEFYIKIVGTNRKKNFDEMDLLIILREYVRITKYMHTSGVFHPSIEITDIWFRKHQGFVYDFKLAFELTGRQNTLRGKLRAARGDWKDLFLLMFLFIKFNDSRWDWLGFSVENPDDFKRMEHVSSFVLALKNDSESDVRHTFSGLRKVFGEFAKHAHRNDYTPPLYDEFYQVIVEELEIYAQQKEKPAIPSWLSNPDDIRDAIAAIATIPNISKIRNPFASTEIPVEYDEVNPKYFHNLYHSQPSSSGTSGRSDRGKKSTNYFDD